MVSVTPWLTLIPVSRLITNNADKNIKKTGFNLSRTPDQKVVVGLSHWPLLPKQDQLTDSILAFNPEVIFSGHYHHGGLWRLPRIQKLAFHNQSKNESKGPPSKKPHMIFHQAEDSGPIVVDTGSEQMTEVVVPAVSYRMGILCFAPLHVLSLDSLFNLHHQESCRGAKILGPSTTMVGQK